MNPASHGVHCAFPVVLLYVPDRHGFGQVVVLVGQKNPTGQEVQLELPASAYVPFGHESGVTLSKQLEKKEKHDIRMMFFQG